ncbi:hypothetical protein PIROE2DRAFT_6093, partial [Piromyces sp. E2]
YTYELQKYVFGDIANDFNEQAKKNNLNIEINVTLYNPSNSTNHVDDYGSMLEHLLMKKSLSYDLFIYDNMYSPRYSPYFEDLRNWLPEEHIKMYSSGVASQTCTYEDKWVGLPLCVDYSLLYSNMELLNKYQKEIPKTWNELIETGKYILQKEKENGNENLVGYYGLFTSSDTSMCSFIEFIHSFRKSRESPYPSYESKEAINALNTLKKLKNELSSDDIFKMSEVEVTRKLTLKDGLFIKDWMERDEDINSIWKKTVLVGNNEGVSGSSVGLFNIGINKHISERRKKIAADIIKFATSKEIQKKYVLMKHKIFSGINSLYDDEEVCKIFDCQIAKNIQPIGRPSSISDNYNKYSLKFRNYLEKFLYGSEDTSITLQKFIDITKVYTISRNPNESLEEYEVVTSLKCELRLICLSLGYTLIYTPILYQLIKNLPISHKFILWSKNNKLLFFIISIMYDVFLNISFTLYTPFNPELMIINDGKNFYTCKLQNNHGKRKSLNIKPSPHVESSNIYSEDSSEDEKYSKKVVYINKKNSLMAKTMNLHFYSGNNIKYNNNQSDIFIYNKNSNTKLGKYDFKDPFNTEPSIFTNNNDSNSSST